MASAFNKDIRRTIAHSRKRFASILVICVLGVTMAVGLRAACVDLRQAADEFYDAQKLYDICVQSTLGLTDDDVEAVSGIEGVGAVVGAYEESTYTSVGSIRASVDVKALNTQGINQPYLLDGRLPETADEVSVTENYLTESGASIGDVVTLAKPENSDEKVFKRHEYTIVGTVIDPTEMVNPTGSVAIRASASSDYSFFTTADAVTADAYTALYISAAGSADALCYSDECTQLVAAVQQRIEDAAPQREEARTAQVKDDANAEIDDAEAEAQEELDSAKQEIDDAQAEINSGWSELNSSQSEITSGEAQIKQAETQLDEKEAELASGKKELEAGKAKLKSAKTKAKSEYESGVAQIDEGLAQVEAGIAQIDASLEQLDAAVAAGQLTEEQAAAQKAEAQAKRSALVEQQSTLKQQKANAKAQYEAGLAKIEKQEAKLKASEEKITSGEAQIASARKTLAAKKQQLASGKSQLESGKQELISGQAELDSATQEYEEGKTKAEKKIADARAEVDDIEDARWYVQNRESNASYASIESDADSIESIGDVFPVVFVVIAVLIGLTTITRMVEEERGLIGTYKSLGYGNAAIAWKYVVYALIACVIGGILGDTGGFIVLPFILQTVFEMMYILPSFPLVFDPVWGLGVIVLFTVGIAGSALLACRSELDQTPATLMRPKAPRNGSRIFLERIKPIWNRLSFLNKVTARNLFRYKKRLFMTIFGIMGCMALLICGFAVKDTVHTLSAVQYEDINKYDVLAVVQADDLDKAEKDLAGDERVEAVQPLTVDTVSLTANGDEESLQLFILPDGTDMSGYINLQGADGQHYELDSDGLYLTRNAAELMGVADGGSVHMQTSALDEADVTVAHVLENYLSNAAYLTESAYEKLIGTPERNGFYITLASSVEDQVAFADELGQDDAYLSITSTQQLQRDFSKSFELINMIVYVIIVLAAALAFVVLFTLSNTNISERVRELATIKVLGFRRRECNHYVNKETVLLTGLGVLCGLPAGWAFSHSLTYVLKMPSIYFAVTIDPLSYVYAASLTLIFAFIVALLSNRSLAQIDMIEALKSVE